MEQNQKKPRLFVMQTDGGSVNNPGPGSIGWYIMKDRNMAAYGHGFIGDTTNNLAEYEAMKRGIEYAVEHRLFPLHIKADSQLVVNHINGTWRCKDPKLQEQLDQIKQLLAGKKYEVSWVLRGHNQAADQLVNIAHDAMRKGAEPYYTVVKPSTKGYDPLVAQLISKHLSYHDR